MNQEPEGPRAYCAPAGARMRVGDYAFQYQVFSLLRDWAYGKISVLNDDDGTPTVLRIYAAPEQTRVIWMNAFDGRATVKRLLRRYSLRAICETMPKSSLFGCAHYALRSRTHATDLPVLFVTSEWSITANGISTQRFALRVTQQATADLLNGVSAPRSRYDGIPALVAAIEQADPAMYGALRALLLAAEIS